MQGLLIRQLRVSWRWLENKILRDNLKRRFKQNWETIFGSKEKGTSIWKKNNGQGFYTGYCPLFSNDEWRHEVRWTLILPLWLKLRVTSRGFIELWWWCTENTRNKRPLSKNKLDWLYFWPFLKKGLGTCWSFQWRWYMVVRWAYKNWNLRLVSIQICL